MARNLDEERQALEAFRDWRTEHPDAGFIVSTVRIDSASGCAFVRIAHTACCAVSLIATAADLLDAAADALEADPFGQSLVLLGHVQRARDALDIGEPEAIQ